MSTEGARMVCEVFEKMREVEVKLIQIGAERMGVRNMDKQDIFLSSVLHRGLDFMQEKIDEVPVTESKR